MTPAALLRILKRFKIPAGVVGVALGPKEVMYSTRGNPFAVTFFVREKLPIRGARKRLADGRVRLPKFVELQGTQFPTDVVQSDTESADEGRTRSPPQVFRAGGKVSNLQMTGTLGCLVRQAGSNDLFALTNRHIALDPGTVVAFPDFQASDKIGGTTSASVGLIPDERFLPLFNAPETYIDVDCALIRIPPGARNRFSSDIPNFGAPTGIFFPAGTNTQEYSRSLIGQQVVAYSWKSGPRTGTISHVYYVYQRSSLGMQRVACFLVKSLDSSPPGIQGDSGKLWMIQQNGQNLCAGIHMGVVAESASSSRFAMVTEFASLSRFLKISPA
jgi:hypothetical protein